MAEENLPPTGQPQPPNMPEPGQAPGEPPTQDAPPLKRRRRGWWWKIPAILLVCLILLVLLAPMIASTGPVRSFAIGIVNDNLNGRVELEDWSLGWLRGIEVRGLKVYDDQNRQILELGTLDTDLTLMDVLQSDYSLGDARVDVLRFQLEIDEQGRTNFEKLAKQDPAAQKPPSDTGDQRTVLPDLSGTVAVSDLGGTIVAAGQPPVHIDPSSAVIKIPDINAPIANEIKLHVRVADGPPGTITAAGMIDIADENQLLEELSGNQKVVLSSIDATAVSPFLKLAGVDLILNGTAGGELSVQTEGGSSTIIGEVLVNNFAATGELLNGDTLRTEVVRIPINVTQATAGGVNMLTVDALGVDMGELGRISLEAKAPVESLAAAAAAVPQAIQSALLGGVEAQRVDLVGQGQAELAIQLNAAAIAQQLPRTLQLDQDLQLQSGQLASTTTVTIAEGQARLASTTTLENFAGVSGGQPVRLEPITLTANAIATGGSDPDLRDVQLAFDSGFGRLSATGPALTNIAVDGRFDLNRLEDQASQFMAMGDLEMSGTAILTAATEGDMAQARGDMGTRLNFVAENLRVAGLDGLGVIDQPRIELTYAGVIERGGEAFAAAIRDAAVTFVAGQPQTPTVRFAANGQATLAPEVSAQFAVTEMIVPRLPQFYAELQQIVPALRESDLQVLAGQLRTTLAGTYSGDSLVLTEPLAVAIEGLTLTTAQATGEPILRDEDINLAAAGTVRLGDAMGIDLKSLAVTTESDLVRVQKAPDVDLSFALREPVNGEMRDLGPLEMVRSANLSIEVPRVEKLWALMQAMTPTEPVSAEEEADEPVQPLQVAGGSVAVSLAIARPTGAAQTNIDIDELRVTNFALARGTRQWQGDMRLALQAAYEGGDALQSLSVSELTGQLGVAELTMTEPIRISDPAGNLAAQGGIRLAGQVGSLTALLETLQGADPGEGYPYNGAYVVTQRVETRGDTIALVGDLAVNDFQVMQEGQVTFAEERIDLTNNILIDRPKQVLSIEDLTLAMRSSEAVQVAVKGMISDWDETRKIRDMTVRLNYDLASLWPIVRPMVTDEGGALAQLAMSGQVERVFRISGAYPAEMEFRRAIKRLVVDGSIAVPLVEGDGLRLENLEIPISLREGRLATIPLAEAAAPPAPAVLNGGTLNLNNFIVDLTGSAPRLTIEDNHVLMQDVAMSPLMMQAGGQYLNFLFAGATEAQGLLTVGIDYCRELALGDRITTPRSGTAKVVFSLDRMQLVNPKGGWLAEQFAAAVEKVLAKELGDRLPVGQLASLEVNKGVADVYKGRIRNAVVVIENGRLYQDITLEVIDPNKALDVIAAEQRVEEESFPLRIHGEVSLKTLQQNLTFYVPQQLLDKWFSQKEIVQALPEGLPVALGGRPTQTTVDFGDIAVKIALGWAQQQLPGLIGGQRDGAAPPKSPEEFIGGLLERAGGRERRRERAPDEVIGRPDEPVPEPDPSQIIGREAEEAPTPREERRRRRREEAR